MQSDIVYQMYLQMSDNERNDFLQKVYNELKPVTSSNTFESIILAKSNHPLQDRTSCPHCQSLNCVKNGHKDGLQSFRCNDCHKTFTWSNNTIYFGSKKSFETWSLFCECLMNKFSLRRCSEVCKINFHTAFNWRHKVLDALQNMHNAVVLNGIIESDETFFGLSFKGSRHLNKKPHKRGLAATKRGLSAEKVCVPCSVNLNRYSIAKITNLGKPCLLIY